ncbi:MAG TPA: BamA/TamA family outer membrane protein [Burkholderiaceae bacterium]|nr:BamA/TamA family outer membrane protein [Burkholderiaceae bacterium]
MPDRLAPTRVKHLRPSHPTGTRRWLRRAALLPLAALLLAGPAAAEIRVEVNGVDGTLRHNVLALLSLERYKDRDRIEPDAVARLFRRVDGEVRDALRPFGYYAPVISATLTPEDEQRNWRVQIDITPGEPVLLDNISISIRGAGANDPVFERVATGGALVRGARLEHAAYEKVKTDLQSAAATFGYLDARLLRSELQVDPAAHRANVVLELETGERYAFGATTIEQNAIREPQLRRYLRYQEGEPFDAGKLLRTQFALDDSQFFSSVDLLPDQRDPVRHIVPIRITAKAARTSYSFGAGYGTDTGARGTVSWLDPRVNDRGHRMRVSLQLSQTTQNINARYDVPFGDPVLEKMSLQFVDQTQQIGSNVYSQAVLPAPVAPDTGFTTSSATIDTREVSLTPSISLSTGRWQRVFSAKFAHDVTSDAIDNRKVDNLVVPSIVIAAIPEGYLGEELFSRSLYAQLDGSVNALGAKANFLRLDVHSEQVFNFASVWHLLLRGEVGISAVHNFDELPAAYRFFAGGDRSVRGFGYDDLSPLRTVRQTGTIDSGPNAGQPFDRFVSQRIGGRHLLTGTVEFERDLPRNLGVAAFSDFGNALDRLDDKLAISVGVGLRWRLPVVTVGIDVAKALHAPGFASLPGPRLHLNISPRL